MFAAQLRRRFGWVLRATARRSRTPTRSSARVVWAVILLGGILAVTVGRSGAGVLVGQIAREGARLAPALDGWLAMDVARGKAILQETLPAVAELGPDPPPHFGWQHTLRSWAYVALGYDISEPRSFVLATLAQRSVEEQSGSEIAVLESIPRMVNSQPEEAKSVEGPDVVHAQTSTLAMLRKRDWGSEPLVLIFHTHTSEMYAWEGVSRGHPQEYHRFNTTDTGVVRVGETIARTLSERYGIPVLHSKAIHDFPSYTQSYQKAANTVQRLVAQNPSIRLVIDVHRDGAENISFVRDLGTQKLAQVMVVVTKPGNYSEQLHPRWRENVRLAESIKKTMEELYPGLLRPYPIVGSNRYNQHLHPHMVLLEVGNYADDEKYALRSAALMADVLAHVLHDLPSATVRASTPSPSSVPAASSRVQLPLDTGRVAVDPPAHTPTPRAQRP